MEVIKDCEKCECDSCLYNNGEHACPGCHECNGTQRACLHKIDMETFLNELHVHLEEIRVHFNTIEHNTQLWKWIEEAGELTVELSKSKNDWSNDKVIEEAADYMICLLQHFKVEPDYSKYEKPEEWQGLIVNLCWLYMDQDVKDYHDKNLEKLATRVVSNIYVNIMNSQSLDRFNYYIFQKIMRTQKRIINNYYKEEV